MWFPMFDNCSYSSTETSLEGKFPSDDGIKRSKFNFKDNQIIYSSRRRSKSEKWERENIYRGKKKCYDLDLRIASANITFTPW